MKRDSILINNIAGSLVIKGLAMLTSFATTPAYLRYFDNNATLGVWFTIISLLNWIMVFDIGVGNGLRNKLVGASYNRDTNLKQRLVSSSYAVLGGLCLIMCVVGGALVHCLDWNLILGISNNVVSLWTLRLSVSIVMGGIIIQFWLKLITSILYSEQKTALANSLTLITSVGMLAFVVLFRVEPLETKLIYISVAQSVLLNLPTFVATIIEFTGSMRDARPRLGAIDKKAAKSVMGLGLAFFAIQLFLLVVNSTNELLIGLIFSSKDVVDYQIYYKLLFTLVSIFTILVQPMWSALTQAFAEKNIHWMKKIYKYYNRISAVGFIAAMVILVFIKPIVKIWIGGDAIEVSESRAFTLVIWAGITMFINSSTCIANAVSRLKCQIVFSGLAAIAKIPVAFTLSNIIDSWEAVVLANCLVLVPLLIAQSLDINRFFKDAVAKG